MKRRLWWIADDDIELYEWKRDILNQSGIAIIQLARLPKGGRKVHIIFELEETQAPRLLGYTPKKEEWLGV